MVTYLYTLGNALRGELAGRFETDDEAWDELSERFNNLYPSRDGRTVYLTKVVRSGKTAGGNETDIDRRLREAAEQLLAQDKE